MRLLTRKRCASVWTDNVSKTFACDGSGTCPSCDGKGSRLVREVSDNGFEGRHVTFCDYCDGSGRCPDCPDETA